MSLIRESKLDPPPSNVLFRNEDDHSYFQVFQERTTPLYLDISTRKPAIGLVCNCLREAFVTHTVVGISALDKTLEAASYYSARDLEYIGRGDGHVHHEFAAEQGSNALRLMRNAAGSGKASLSQE
jgi:hypothetical protein